MLSLATQHASTPLLPLWFLAFAYKHFQMSVCNLQDCWLHVLSSLVPMCTVTMDSSPAQSISVFIYHLYSRQHSRLFTWSGKSINHHFSMGFLQIYSVNHTVLSPQLLPSQCDYLFCEPSASVGASILHLLAFSYTPHFSPCVAKQFSSNSIPPQWVLLLVITWHVSHSKTLLFSCLDLLAVSVAQPSVHTSCLPIYLTCNMLNMRRPKAEILNKLTLSMSHSTQSLLSKHAKDCAVYQGI